MRCVFVISEFLYCQIHNWIKLLPSFFIIIIIISLCKIHIQTHIHTHIHYASSKQRFSCHSGNYRLKTHSKHVCDTTEINSQLYFPDKYLQHDSIIWPVFLNDYKLSGCWLESRCSHLITYIAPVSRKEFLDIQATTDCRLTLRRVCDMIKFTVNWIISVNWIITQLNHLASLAKWLSVSL